MGGKGSYEDWKNLFEAFGLSVDCIADFDFVIERFYPLEKGVNLSKPADVRAFKVRNPTVEADIETEYAKHIYILKNGDLEYYLGIRKGLTEVIDFCNNNLQTFLADDENPSSIEIRDIVKQITA